MVRPRPSLLSSRSGHHTRPGNISMTSDWPTTEDTIMASWQIYPSTNSRCCSRDDSGLLSYPLCNYCPEFFFLTILFTATFCILSTAAPYPQEKSVKNTTLYFLLFRKRVTCYLIDRQPSHLPLNLPFRSLSDLNCLTINSTHAKCSKTSVWFIAPSCLPWRVNLSAILSQSRPCPYLPAW